MHMVSIKELKNCLSYYLRRVGQGEEVIVTEQGKPKPLFSLFLMASMRSAQNADWCGWQPWAS